MASSSTTLQVEALSVVHANYADDEKRGLKRRLATSEKELNNTEALQRYKEACTALEMEDIKRHCEASKEILNGVHKTLVDGFRDGGTLSKRDALNALRSIIDVSHCLASIQDKAVKKSGTTNDVPGKIRFLPIQPLSDTYTALAYVLKTKPVHSTTPH